MSEARECGNKRSYLTKHDAKQAEKMLRTLAGGSRQHLYRCSFCDRWHMGHGSQPLDSPGSLDQLTLLDLKRILRDIRSRLQPGLPDEDRAYWHGRLHAIEDRIQEMKEEEANDDALAAA
jgi:hypothetical protein